MFQHYKVLMALSVTSMLTACGGDLSSGSNDSDDVGAGIPVTSSIGGSLSGNSGAVTLALNGMEETFSGTNFTFSKEVSEGIGYLVEFVSTSDGQICSVTNGSGFAQADVDDIVVACSVVASRIDVFDGEIGALESGDFNGDGFIDVAFKLAPNGDHPQGNEGLIEYVRVYYGLGTGGFSTSTDIRLVGQSLFHSGSRGRFSNDVIDDYVTLSTPSLETFLGNASNSFSAGFRTTRTLDNNLSAASQVNVADISGDGLDDMIVTLLGGSEFEYYASYLSNGDGSFTDQVLFGFRPPGSVVGSIIDSSVRDYTGDDIPDILALISAGGEFKGNLALYLAAGVGDGIFIEPNDVQLLPEDLFFGEQVSGYSPNEMAVTDIDGDGDLDIGLYSTSDYILILKNNGTGNFDLFQQVTVGNEPLYASFADMNNDALIDLVTLVDGSREAVISFGQVDGIFGELGSGADHVKIIEFEEADDSYGSYNTFRGLELIDLNLDGTMDITLTEASSTRSSTSGLYSARGSLRILMAPGL